MKALILNKTGKHTKKTLRNQGLFCMLIIPAQYRIRYDSSLVVFTKPIPEMKNTAPKIP